MVNLKDLMPKRWHSAGDICSFGGKLKDILPKGWHSAWGMCNFGGRLKDPLQETMAHCSGRLHAFEVG